MVLNDLYSNESAGFTLIELLVVISIISLLSSVVLASINGVRESARESRVQADLQQIRLAIEQLKSDTGLLPNGLNPSECIQNPEAQLDQCAAGIECNDGTFSGWGGPYMEPVPEDPWGTVYQFDPDYKCKQAAEGCEQTDSGLDTRAIFSCGPNQSCGYDSDNIVRVMCKR